MSFDTLSYLVFLPVVCLLHWLLPSRYRWLLLLLASYVFYASWHVELSLLIFGVTTVTWLAGLFISRTASLRIRRVILLCALTLCLGTLGYFKYLNLLGSSFAALTGGAWRVRDIILPVGISFYTFQAMSYVIDVYRRKMEAERHFGYYALYISFFPQLVAGPIERADTLIAQLRRDRQFSSQDAVMGLRLILSGFFRKIVIADLAAPFVDAVYQASSPDGSAVLIGTVLFAVQIYCDFSGYSEIAAGSARLMGVRLMRNFDRSYGAENIRAFWRRWHISLTRWFTDYVYIPLGGNRRGLIRQIMAIYLVFALCGLWHGAEWSFLVWGLLHACFMVLYTLHRSFRPEKKENRSLGRILTLGAVCFAWIFFRAENLWHALGLIQRLFSVWDIRSGLELLMSASRHGVSAPALGALGLMLLLTLNRLPVITDERKELPLTVWAAVLLALLLGMLIRADSGTANAFIYFQF